MIDIDIEAEALKIAGKAIENTLVFMTPDNILEAVDTLVDTVASEDISGAEKFQWVLGEVKDMLVPALKWLLMAIIEIAVTNYKAKQIT